MLQPNNIRMPILHQLSHNLQLSILKSFILQYFFNGDNFPRFHHGCLEDHAEGAVAYDSFGGVGDGFVGGGCGCVMLGGSASEFARTSRAVVVVVC